MFSYLSILKSIDFTNRDNQIFVALTVGAFLIIFFIFIEIVVRVIIAIKKMLGNVSKPSNKKPELDNEQVETKQEVQNIQNEVMSLGAVVIDNKPITKEDSKNNQEDELLQLKLKAENKKELEQKNIEKNVTASMGAKLDYASVPKNQKSKINAKSVEQRYDEKEKMEVEAGLGKLKGVNPSDSGSQGGVKRVSLGSTIEIPTSSDVHRQKSDYENKIIKSEKKVSRISESGKAGKVTVTEEKHTSVPTRKDDSIFNGAEEVSREKLKDEMETDTKIWKASQQAGLNLSPTDRAKLVEEVFSPELGRNISKPDLKLSIKKLNKKLLSTNNPNEHVRIRKEINFFKKIGGIK